MKLSRWAALAGLIVTLAACSGPAPSPGAPSPSASADSATPAPSSPPPLPPDKDPTKPEYQEVQISDGIGGPAGFQTFHSDSFQGSALHVEYSFHCDGNGCTDQVVPLLAAWARRAGAPATAFRSGTLYGCLHTSCTVTYPRDRFTMWLTASVVPDTTFTAKPGDLLYLAALVIEPT